MTYEKRYVQKARLELFYPARYMFSEEVLSQLNPANLRLAESEYFHSQYVRHCGPPMDTYALMVAYFDAFLFTFASVEDMANESEKSALRGIKIVRFFKALRNITTHHSILAAPIEGKFARPFSRHVGVSIGGQQNDSSRLRLRLDILLSIFEEVEKQRASERQTIEVARDFIGDLDRNGTPTYLEDLMAQAILAARGVLTKA